MENTINLKCINSFYNKTMNYAFVNIKIIRENLNIDPAVELFTTWASLLEEEMLT